jgi:hypothetical protein
MQLEEVRGLLTLRAETYTLTFAVDRPFVYLDDAAGERLAELFVLSSVHPLHDRDDTLSAGSWQVEQAGDEVLFSLAARSSVWSGKTYRFRCTARRFLYEIEVEGRGRLAEANYFGGYYSGQPRWGSGFFRSGQFFRTGFNPEPNTAESSYFEPCAGSVIDLTGVPLPGKGSWFFTPAPFAYGFTTGFTTGNASGSQAAAGAESPWLGIGVEARPGCNRFTEFAYHGGLGSFYFSLSYEGHTAVDGRYALPSLGFDFAPDEYAALEAHVSALRRSGLTDGPRARLRPAWWREPIFCGWGAQCGEARAEGGRAPDYSRQSLYECLLGTLEQNGVCPGIVVLDDKWQRTYGENLVDEARWPDLPGFIAGQHERGRHVLLWLKAWDAEGVAAEQCITNAAGAPLAVDPSHPAYAEHLRASVRRMLGPKTEGGYDADGFKIDFSARIPTGPGLCLYGDAWGLELMKLYLGILHDEAKRVKPEALIIAHAPHPYLSGVLDMVRLNDINVGHDVLAAMTRRATVAGIACPEALIDTDNWPMRDKATWRAYAGLQPALGVPALYFASCIDSTGEPLDAEDYALLRETWARYRAGLHAGTAVEAEPAVEPTPYRVGARQRSAEGT